MERKKAERGRRLKLARKRANLTQEQVAECILEPGATGKYRQQTISDWERGEAEPTFEQLVRLHELYGFEWGWFFSGREPGVELRAYHRIAKIVLETEGVMVPSPSPSAVERVVERVARPTPEPPRKRSNG